MKMKLIGNIKPHASIEEAEKIRPNCIVERYVNYAGTHMLKITHSPTGESVESNTGEELSALRLLAANLPEMTAL